MILVTIQQPINSSRLYMLKEKKVIFIQFLYYTNIEIKSRLVFQNCLTFIF